MKLATIITVLYLSGSGGSDDLDKLEDLYQGLDNVYQHFTQKRSLAMEPAIWQDWTKEQKLEIKETTTQDYDFIIVGSGSAGSVLANRLSEIPHWKILLLEAGKGENKVAQVPLVAPALQFSHYNWHHYMEYQPNMCLGLTDQRMHWPRGRALGGTSVINYMIYTRGNRLDFDRWAASGNPGWSYNDVLPYFIKSERAKLNRADYRFHGTDGFLSVEDIYQSPLVNAFVEAGLELGYPNFDYNANVEPFGMSTIQATVRSGRRHSHARAFLHPIRQSRPNLHILTSAFVTGILIDPTNREAYGVEYERMGEKHRIRARKEVILSAGAYNSPQLLILAGIGPREHLQELGIPLLQDLPVGQNLHDHLTYPGLSFLLDQQVSLSASNILTPSSIFGYLLNGTGPITSLGGVEGIGYIKTALSPDPQDVPDIELLFVGASLNTDYGIVTRRGMNIRDDIYDGLFRPTHNIPNWTIFPMLLHPKSTGYLKLRSRNPYEYPLLYGNYFTDPDDLDINTFVEAIRFIQKLSQTKAFQRFGSRLNPNRIPGCELYEFDSDDYWRCALRSISVTLHHQVGTAKMGPPGDPGAVVNHELKVYGVGKLRVADCSIIPFALGAHTNAPSTMVGEKAADLIKEAWGELIK